MRRMRSARRETAIPIGMMLGGTLSKLGTTVVGHNGAGRHVPTQVGLRPFAQAAGEPNTELFAQNAREFSP